MAIELLIRNRTYIYIAPSKTNKIICLFSLMYRANLTPNRKKSSEEKSVSIDPSLLTITDAIGPAMVGLTESSSSGLYFCVDLTLLICC